ncbi:MAG: hypothetical protein ABEK10_01830 [Candidatus Nanosalina sp.]
MRRNQIKVKMLIAATLTLSTVLMVSLKASSSKPAIYAMFFTAANFAGFVFVYNRTSKLGETFPLKTISAQAAMISAGFTYVIASTFSTTLPPMKPQNLAIYTAVFIIVTLVLLPDKLIDRIDMELSLEDRF